MVGAVRKALDILELFSCAEPRLTLAQINQRLAIPNSTAHNLLRTLVERGYVERPDRDHYALGSAICPLTLAVRVNVEVRDRAAPKNSLRSSGYPLCPGPFPSRCTWRGGRRLPTLFHREHSE